MSITMSIELTVSLSNILDAILCGVEGGITYWARVTQYWVPGRGGLSIEPVTDLHLVCDLVERDSGRSFSLRGKWQAALRLMAERYPRKFAEVLEGSVDSTTGDILIQLATFGEVKYG